MNNESNKTYVCITECINTHHLAISDTPIRSLEEAKKWIADNRAYGSYRIYNIEKIVEINIRGETEQVYTKTPNSNGEWRELY